LNFTACAAVNDRILMLLQRMVITTTRANVEHIS
jgi:hypothetical protein